MNETQAVLFGPNNHNNSTTIIDKNTSAITNSNSNNSTFNVDKKNEDKDNVKEQQLDDTYTLQPINDNKEDQTTLVNETVTISPTIRDNLGTTSRTKRKSARRSSNSNNKGDDDINKQQQHFDKKKSRMEPITVEIREPLPCEDEDNDDEMTSSMENESRVTKDKSVRRNNIRSKRNASAIHHSMVLPGEMNKDTTSVGTPLRPRRNPRRRSTAN